MSPKTTMDFEALILAGGRGSRLGGIDKAELHVHGRRLVDRVISAAREAGATTVTVVGPDSAGTMADRVLREQPAFGGPLAGIAAGIRHVTAPWVMVLACDLQHPQAVITHLVFAPESGEADGVILVDQDGREQWMAGTYRTESVARICDQLGEAVANAPVRKALMTLSLERRPISNQDSLDIDTPEALEQARTQHSTTRED